MDGIAEQNVIGVPNWQQASSSFTEKVILQNIRVRVPRREYAVFFVAFLGIAALIRCANEIEREFDRWLVDSLIEIQTKRRRHVRTPTLITTDGRLEIFWSGKKPTGQVTIYLCISGVNGGRTGFARNVSQRSKTRADHSRTYKAKRGACQRYIYGWISRVWKAFD